jgi:hypothetical protein
MVKILKILKNLFLSLLISSFIAFIIPLAFEQLLHRFPKASSWNIILLNAVIIAFLIFLTSFVHFNSTKDSYKKKSDKLFIILVIYCFTSTFLLTMSSPWEFRKSEVAWQESPLYITSVGGDTFDIFVRWDEGALELASEYNIPPLPEIGFNSHYCSKAGVYEVRLRDNSSVRFETYDNGTEFVGVDFADFNNIPGIRSWGKNTLLISDPCGDQHQIDVSGYNQVRTFKKGRF